MRFVALSLLSSIALLSSLSAGFASGCGLPTPTPAPGKDPEKQGASSGPGFVAANAAERPSREDSLPGHASARVRKKTRKVMKQAEDPNAGKQAALLSELDPALVALKDKAVGKVLVVPEHALDHFFAALDRTQAKDKPGVARVLHIGDSFVGQDVFPYAIRRRMQTLFGDAGPGFQLVDLHHRSNVSRSLDLRSEHWDTCSVRNACLGPNGWYGYGAHLARGRQGATSVLTPRYPEAFAHGTGIAEVWYQTQNEGATLELESGGKKTVIETLSEVRADAWTSIALAAGDPTVTLTVTGPGRAFAYGVSFESGQPGVVWDAVIVSGAFTSRLEGFDKEHLARQIDHRSPDLLVFNFGGNDMRRAARKTVTLEGLQAELEAGIETMKGGRAEMSCLVVSSTDHARSGKTDVKPPAVQLVVDAERAAAASRGCAFLDALETFGGVGKAEELSERRPQLVANDRSHLTTLGREVLAEVLVAEIQRHYATYLDDKRGTPDAVSASVPS